MTTNVPYDHLTLAIGLTLLAVIIFYDVWTLLKRGYESTFSVLLYTISKANPIIPFALGIVCGHLFWGM